MTTTQHSTPAASSQTVNETLLQKIGRARHFSVSLLLHTVAIIVLGTIVLQRAGEPIPVFEGGGIEVSTNVDAAESDPQMRIPEDPGGEKVVENAPSSFAPPAISLNNPTALFAFTPGNLIGKSINETIGRLGGEGSESGVSGKGPGSWRGTTVPFLGKPMTVKDVVLVLDVSSSMISGVKSDKTYEVLEREASNVINGLTAKNKFGVVVFSKEAKVYQEHLVPASQDTKSSAIQWLKRMSPVEAKGPRVEEEVKLFHHGTRADLALKAAFDLNPDMIFFVSDGEPTGTTVPAILAQVQAAQDANNKFIDIHTIAYLADSGQQFMRDLAAKHRGTFREVNPKDVK